MRNQRKYEVTVASDVADRDGIGLELRDDADTLILEVFRDDKTGETTVVLTGEAVLPFEVVERFIARARDFLFGSP